MHVSHGIENIMHHRKYALPQIILSFVIIVLSFGGAMFMFGSSNAVSAQDKAALGERIATVEARVKEADKLETSFEDFKSKEFLPVKEKMAVWQGQINLIMWMLAGAGGLTGINLLLLLKGFQPVPQTK